MQRRWKSVKKDKDLDIPFHLQIYESVHKRVQREREEEERRARFHQGTVRGRAFGTAFGMLH